MKSWVLENQRVEPMLLKLAVVFCLWNWFLCTAGHAAGEFRPPEKITDGLAKYRLSRTSNGHLAVSDDGTLHVVYWSGSDLGTTPGTPSFIYYRTWRPDSGWSAQVSIDDSTVSGGAHIGGRHPALALTRSGAVWVVWNDSRNCTASGNWIDNVEIYADFKSAGGNFSSQDVRLTSTSASHLGDNGFTPKIVAHGDGRLSVAWFDFHFNADVSDLFLRTSDPTGVFDPNQSLTSMRLTDESNRGGTPSYTVPDLTLDSGGNLCLVWVGGFGPGGNLYYGQVQPGSPTFIEQVLETAVADFFDPPHITSDKAGGVWVVYADDSAPSGENITVLHRPAGTTTFESPIIIEENSARQYAPDLEVDDDGILHIVWVDERSGRKVYYARFDPSSGGVLEVFPLTQESGNWERPTITLDSDGKVYVLWEESRAVDQGDLWFTTTVQEGASSIHRWNLYR